jgi:hypothetical protein
MLLKLKTLLFPQILLAFLAYKIAKCVKGYYNPKGNYNIEYRATPTSNKCEGRIRYLGGINILC